MRPVAPGERLPLIDALRGVALIGIIIANMRGFNSPMEVYMKPDLLWDAPSDLIAQAFIDCFVSGKFILIFAVLFGLGFAIQMERAEERNQEFAGLYIRRMIGLALFGAAHVVLLWWGDILLSYAGLGVLLLLFRRADRDSIVRWGLMLYWFPVFLFLCLATLSLAGGDTSPSMPAASAGAIEAATAIYSGTDFAAQLQQRLVDWQAFNSGAPFFLARVLSFFLFGLWVWREGIARHPERYLGRMRRWWPLLLALGVAGNVISTAINQYGSSDPLAPTALNIAMWFAASIGIPALSLVYMIAVILAFQTERGQRLLAPFALVGRMAATNYVMQSVICTAIFYGWGLGLFGRMAPLAGLVLAVAVYVFQVFASAVWLRYYRYGPLEWLWRTMTYGRYWNRAKR